MNCVAIWIDHQQAHTSLTGRIWPESKAMMTAGHRLLVTVKVLEDERSIQQNKFYWAILNVIANQANVGGQRWSADAWHELFKRQFLPRKVKKTKVAGKKRPVVSVTLGSTTELSIKRMGEYLEKLIAFAVTDLGVVFMETRWDAPQIENRPTKVIDPETGEIIE